MAAQLTDPLAHLSLSYRYQLSLDGFENDVDLQAGIVFLIFIKFYCVKRLLILRSLIDIFKNLSGREPFGFDLFSFLDAANNFR